MGMKMCCAMFRTVILLSFFFIAFIKMTPAQQLDHLQGELLVQFSGDIKARQWLVDYEKRQGDYPVVLDRCVSRPANIWLLSFDFTRINEQQLRSILQQERHLQAVQFNHFIKLRTTIPDDPQFNQQWQYINTGQSGGTPGADLDAELAWDITTGGLTALGDTIVVCVIDNGIDIDHPDLVDNLWINHAEVPDNGQDDDGNGYVDDYYGWNVNSNSDNIEGGSHGTSVSGIVGARGDNGLGVTGVNWQVKVMVVRSDFQTSQADVLAAYTYPLIQRQRYNASNGLEGAFVVATNASWGADELFPEDAPLWCNFYDTLGVHGILNVGATANTDTNVDQEGDLPTTCTSDYLISVTNLDANNQKVTTAGYGATSIDLGAYGAVWTIQNGASYGNFPGTSAATPHVTGTIGLLYAADCPEFIQVAKQSPSTAALLAKDYILNSAIFTPSLDGITVTEGRLNMLTSLNALLAGCGDCLDPANLGAVSETETTAQISWVRFDNHTRIDLRWRVVGAPTWNEQANATSPFDLSNLTACTEYEFQVKGYCEGVELSYTNSYVFTTEGCCDLPQNLGITSIGFEAAILSWSSVLAADNYTIRFRQDSNDPWTQLTAVQPFFGFNNLDPCTSYQTQLRTNCDGMISPFSPIITFTTLGCGGCLDQDYCEEVDLSTDEEWIESVQIHTLINNSGNDGGYGDYTGLETLQLGLGESYDVFLEPEHSGVMWSEYFLIWIDLDQDGVFEQSEIVFDPGDSFNTPVSGTLTVPEPALTGNTRMRVAMQFLSAGGPCFFPEGFGEVEDYCVDLYDPNVCDPPGSLTRLPASPDLVTLEWPALPNAIGYLFRYRPEQTSEWTAITVEENTIELSALDTCATYEVEIQTNCTESNSNFSEVFSFNTYCVTSTNELTTAKFFRLFPNPFSSELKLEIVSPPNISGPMQIEVLDIYGRAVFDTSISQGVRQKELLLNHLQAGVYLVRLSDKNGVKATARVIKQ